MEDVALAIESFDTVEDVCQVWKRNQNAVLRRKFTWWSGRPLMRRVLYYPSSNPFLGFVSSSKMHEDASCTDIGP